MSVAPAPSTIKISDCCIADFNNFYFIINNYVYYTRSRLAVDILSTMLRYNQYFNTTNALQEYVKQVPYCTIDTFMESIDDKNILKRIFEVFSQSKSDVLHGLPFESGTHVVYVRYQLAAPVNKLLKVKPVITEDSTTYTVVTTGEE